jgi:serine/threonine protein kinase
MIGQQIRNYRIQSLLGTGGMGSVYLAVHTQLGRRIAIKVIHPSLARNPVVRERFRNEAAALSHLQHPSIVTLYDYSEEEDALYLFMEYVEGKTLDAYIQTETGPIPEDKAVPLFARLLDAVAYAHDRGVIHRDIKPSNLMVDQSGNAKILDFGIAKIMGQGLDGLTKEGTRMGTVLYMSPEQVRGDVLDKRSDVYALGVTLFQILTGRSPYDESNLTEYAVYERILHEPLPRMRSLYPLVTERMQALVDQATVKDPASRFADHQFREALLRLVIPPSPHITAVEPPVISPPRPQAKPADAWHETILPVQEEPPARPPKRRTATWIGVLLAAAILVTILGLLIAMLNEDDRPTPRVRRETPTPKREEPKETRPAASAATAKEDLPEKVTQPVPDTNATDTVLPSEPPAEAQPLSDQLARIGLEYEAIPPEDALGNNRFAVKIVLTNTADDVAFDDVTLKIKFLSESGEVLGTYIYEHGRLPAGAVERFNVERRVQATNATCEVLSAKPVTP